MKVTYLGQNGLLIETKGKIIVIDPYLSNSVAKVEPNNYRRVPVDTRFLKIKPDVIICTHCHLDHFDKETLSHYLNETSNILFLSPYSTWKEAREFRGNNNFVMFNAGTKWLFAGITFEAVKAEHSDEYAIGVIISDEEEIHYITGDTLFNKKVIESLPSVTFDYVYLPINGKGNNMNAESANEFASVIKSKHYVPVHVGMFDDISPESFTYGNVLIPIIYKEKDEWRRL